MTELHQEALSGDPVARTIEEDRLRAETHVIDLRDADHATGDTRCYSAVVHEPHDYEIEVWSEPRWVNPRTVWQHWCVGVQDQTPYRRIVETQKRGVWVWKQDEHAAPGEFPICRRLIASLSSTGAAVNVDVEIWKTPPREWPPVHVGAAGAGMNIEVDEVRALRDWLSSWLEEHDE